LHIQAIHKAVDRLKENGIDDVYCVSFSDSVVFSFLMPKLSGKIKFVQDPTAIQEYKDLLGRRGHVNFLKDYWHFACIVNDGKVEYYIDQPYAGKILPDTIDHIYSDIPPGRVVEYLKDQNEKMVRVSVQESS
jgi:peroxiredoxin